MDRLEWKKSLECGDCKKMTSDEAKVVLLESALRQAQYTVKFLHNCLINPVDHSKKGFQGYSYEHPEQTLDHLKEWAKLAPPPDKKCPHSCFCPDCEACQMRLTEARQLHSAKQVLGIYDK